MSGGENGADRLEGRLGLRGIARVAPRDHAHLLHLVLGREHRDRRHGREAEPAVDVLGRLQDEVAPEAEQLGALVDRPEDRPAVDGADRVAAEQERRHDAEVAAAAADRPEEVGVLLRARRDEPAVREHHVHAEQVVDREAVLAARGSRSRRPASGRRRRSSRGTRSAPPARTGASRGRRRPTGSRPRRGPSGSAGRRGCPSAATGRSRARRRRRRAPARCGRRRAPRAAGSSRAAKLTAAITSATSAHLTISAGRRSIIAL